MSLNEKDFNWSSNLEKFMTEKGWRTTWLSFQEEGISNGDLVTRFCKSFKDNVSRKYDESALWDLGAIEATVTDIYWELYTPQSMEEDLFLCRELSGLGLTLFPHAHIREESFPCGKTLLGKIRAKLIGWTVNRWRHEIDEEMAQHAFFELILSVPSFTWLQQELRDSLEGMPSRRIIKSIFIANAQVKKVTGDPSAPRMSKEDIAGVGKVLAHGLVNSPDFVEVLGTLTPIWEAIAFGPEAIALLKGQAKDVAKLHRVALDIREFFTQDWWTTSEHVINSHARVRVYYKELGEVEIEVGWVGEQCFNYEHILRRFLSEHLKEKLPQHSKTANLRLHVGVYEGGKFVNKGTDWVRNW